MRNLNLDPKDIAGKSHWDAIYTTIEKQRISLTWKPSEYNYKVISLFVEKSIKGNNPSNILEVGCGNSRWLSYLARKYALYPVGIDYSDKGCELARKILSREKIDGEIICCDMFNPNDSLLNKFNIVYSIGVVEHFDNLHHVISTLKTFISSDGTLVTIIPNLYSIHGILCYLWHPDILKKHIIIRMKNIIEIYNKLGFSNIDYQYGGFFSLSIVQWDKCTRWKELGQKSYPYINKINCNIHTYLDKRQLYNGFSVLAPYIMISGKKTS